MDPQVTANAAVALDPAATADGLRTAGPEAVPIAKMMEAQVTAHAAVALDPAVALREPLAIGIAAVEHVEENGKDRVQIQAVNFHGALPNACLIMQLLELSATLQVQQFLRQQPQEIPSGKMVVAVENASC